MNDADFLLYSFYKRQEPTRTKIILFILTILSLAITMMSFHAFIKRTQMNKGVMFLGLFPLTTHPPSSRLLDSPMKQLFWRVLIDVEPISLCTRHEHNTNKFHSRVSTPATSDKTETSFTVNDEKKKTRSTLPTQELLIAPAEANTEISISIPPALNSYPLLEDSTLGIAIRSAEVDTEIRYG
ncbi:MAG: hypothetical protein LQ337_004221 [Flavoplaca oasis]|nr:MAG: hypothetical protein LQ337_004221 [Flavoplaca oasis]